MAVSALNSFQIRNWACTAGAAVAHYGGGDFCQPQQNS